MTNLQGGQVFYRANSNVSESESESVREPDVQPNVQLNVQLNLQKLHSPPCITQADDCHISFLKLCNQFMQFVGKKITSVSVRLIAILCSIIISSKIQLKTRFWQVCYDIQMVARKAWV